MCSSHWAWGQWVEIRVSNPMTWLTSQSTLQSQLNVNKILSLLIHELCKKSPFKPSSCPIAPKPKHSYFNFSVRLTFLNSIWYLLMLWMRIQRNIQGGQSQNSAGKKIILVTCTNILYMEKWAKKQDRNPINPENCIHRCYTMKLEMNSCFQDGKKTRNKRNRIFKEYLNNILWDYPFVQLIIHAGS